MSQIPDKIKKKLAEVAPSIHFRIEWEVDPYYKWDGDSPDPRNNGQFPHDVTIFATAIVNGEIVVGQDCLGGCYEAPGKTCPDVHGYFLSMLSNAINDLREKVHDRRIIFEITQVQKLIEEKANRSWLGQQKPLLRESIFINRNEVKMCHLRAKKRKEKKC